LLKKSKADGNSESSIPFPPGYTPDKGSVRPTSCTSDKDLFGIYELLKKSKADGNSESSIPFPPGYTPDKGSMVRPTSDTLQEMQGDHMKSASCTPRVFEEMENPDIYVQSVGKDGKQVRKEGGSILDALDDMIKVGTAMGFKMDGCINDMEKIIGLNGELKVSIISQWRGEYIVLGDFNEVHCKEERWGSTFHVQGARSFNSFILNAGLNDVQLEGFSFTWSHPSASKMSKLDRFLVSDGILSSFPNISAVCLERHLSDHRPIILREKSTDFGPSPFRFYHSWLSISGFEQMVTSTWNSFNLADRNGMIKFKKKLQGLKKEIRKWVTDFKRVASWFNKLCNAHNDFFVNEHIVWVDIEGVPLNAWSRNSFHKIGSKWGEVLDVEDYNDDMFARKRLCIKTNLVHNILDSFKIIVKGKAFMARAKELFVWSPSFKDVPEVTHCSDVNSFKNASNNNVEDGPGVHIEEESDCDAISDTFFRDS
nr:RNA-directed DNA polymerase, eukaryota [Tanacetum cinerariifolium]